ncbi:MAG: precorrin-8X methylmutase [Pseudomonadota bacterium]
MAETIEALPPLAYERDPAAIYRQSFATIRAETDLDHLPADLEAVAVRMVHTCGMTDLPRDLDHGPGADGRSFGRAAREALRAGAPVLCDANMIVAGVTRSRLPADNAILCTLDAPGVRERAQAIGNTRSAAALDLWGERMAGALVAIGNAPTALFHLLELLDAGAPRPAAILGLPVGFVGAVESKRALADDARGVPFLTLHGRRGGSALTVAAINALASDVE